MLILEGEPELTLYESGKVLVKTDDEGAARSAIDRLYAAIGIAGDRRPREARLNANPGEGVTRRTGVRASGTNGAP